MLSGNDDHDDDEVPDDDGFDANGNVSSLSGTSDIPAFAFLCASACALVFGNDSATGPQRQQRP